MSDRPVSFLLEDLLDAIQRIQRYTDGQSLETFRENQMLQDAVIRNISVIGEVVARIPDSFINQHSGIPWHRMRGMRNRLVHDYLGIDLDLVWTVVRNDLPRLKSQVEALL